MLDTTSQAPMQMPQISVPNSSLFIKYSVMVDVMTCINQKENGIHWVFKILFLKAAQAT